jgi:hypothetical protein
VAIFLSDSVGDLGVTAYFAATGTLYEMFYVSFLNFTYLGTALFGMQIQETRATE